MQDKKTYFVFIWMIEYANIDSKHSVKIKGYDKLNSVTNYTSQGINAHHTLRWMVEAIFLKF